MKTKTHGGKRPGAGRKPSIEKPFRYTIVISNELNNTIDSWRESRGVTQSKNAAIIDLLRAGLSVLNK